MIPRKVKSEVSMYVFFSFVLRIQVNIDSNTDNPIANEITRWNKDTNADAGEDAGCGGIWLHGAESIGCGKAMNQKCSGVEWKA